MTLDQVGEATGFELLRRRATCPRPTAPTDEELRILREEVDPTSMRLREFR